MIPIAIIIFFVLFFAFAFYQNTRIFNSLKKNKGYTFGIVIEAEPGGDGYSRYQYIAGQKEFVHRCDKVHRLRDTILVIYDTTAPRYSIAGQYPFKITVDSNRKIIGLDTSRVHFRRMDFMPIDKIRSIKDLLLLD